ncbi:MAG: hypothetical protein HYX87_01810 [Chloroflexi bacterium]|nr:hypothetical protein [Chloroflexota bacterium]
MGKAWKAAALLLTMIVGSVAVSSCNSNPTAEQLVEKAAKALEKVKDYRATMDGTMAIRAQAQGNQMQANITLSANGAVDTVKKAVEMTADVEMDSPDQPAASDKFTIKLYQVDNMVYLKMSAPNQDGAWVKTAPSDETARQMAALDMADQLSILDGATAKLLPDQNVEGVLSIGIEVTPDLQKLWQNIMRQPGMQDMDVDDPDMLRQVVKEYSAKVWVDKKSYYLVKVEYGLKADFSPETLGLPEQLGTGSMTMDVHVSIRFYNPNKGITITLPNEAKKATQIP